MKKILILILCVVIIAAVIYMQIDKIKKAADNKKTEKK